ncbi:MAG: ABC transporter substrate-binding protein, partial [Candidatus Sericytochromatia bacterium]
MKKIASNLLKTSLVFSILLTSFSCEKTENTNSNKVELWTMQLKPTFDGYMNKLIESYKKQNQGVEVEWVDLPSKEIEQKTLTSIAGGKSPDVINLNPNFTSKMAEEGALSDIEKLVTPDVKNSYLPNIWKASSIGEKTYGFPWYLSTAITIYNKDLLKKAGLDENKPPKNFEELAKMG